MAFTSRASRAFSAASLSKSAEGKDSRRVVFIVGPLKTTCNRVAAAAVARSTGPRRVRDRSLAPRNKHACTRADPRAGSASTPAAPGTLLEYRRSPCLHPSMNFTNFTEFYSRQIVHRIENLDARRTRCSNRENSAARKAGIVDLSSSSARKFYRSSRSIRISNDRLKVIRMPKMPNLGAEWHSTAVSASSFTFPIL